MYLNRFHRYKNVSANQISIIENYIDWMNAKAEGSEYANCTFKEWCGVDESELPDKEIIDYFKQFYKAHHIGNDYTYYTISERVGYWRKCNAIHAWFVDHVQNGIDDCNYHHEVTKEILEELRNNCLTVIKASKLVPGKIYNGTTWQNGVEYKNYVDGTIIEDTTVADSILPTQSGFFFGGTDYDEWYIDSLKDTIDIINNILETTDFKTQMIYYCSSW